jgi:hypothetical protein
MGRTLTLPVLFCLEDGITTSPGHLAWLQTAQRSPPFHSARSRCQRVLVQYLAVNTGVWLTLFTEAAGHVFVQPANTKQHVIHCNSQLYNSRWPTTSVVMYTKCLHTSAMKVQICPYFWRCSSFSFCCQSDRHLSDTLCLTVGHIL